jgi:hypothetical protein
MTTKTEMLSVIQDAGFPHNEVAIKLDHFFSGEDCSDSIGVNVYPVAPAAGKFYIVFKDLLDSGKVDDIFMRITDVEEPGNWFFCDTVYVTGSIETDELEAHVAVLSPDEITEGWLNGKPANISDVPEGQNVYSIWWD